jgi:hypothetical protein
VLSGVVLTAAIALTAPASADPQLILPEGATAEFPAELEPIVAPTPSPEATRARAALADALAAPEASGTVTVTPSAGLVHGQEVTARGTGWAPGHEVTAFQCGPAPLEQGDCEPSVIFEDDAVRVGPGGNVTVRFPAEVILDNPRDPVDCRLVTCRIGLLDFWFNRIRFVDVAFDPGGPDPTRATITVDPSTGVVDGDLLDVSVSGIQVVDDFLPLAQLTMCRTPVTVAADCDRHQVEYRELEDDGSLETTTWASAILDLPTGDYDCRSGTCAVLVSAGGFGPNDLGELSEAAVGDVELDPGGSLQPPPTLTADPDTDLRDGDAIQLHGSGFDPERGINIAQCAADATSSRDCVGGISVFGSTDDGEFDFFFGVLAKFRDARNRTVDCRLQDCAIVVSHGDFGRHARAALRFDPDAPLLDPSLAVTPSTGLHDGDRVRVTGTNWPHDQPLLISQCPTGTDEAIMCDGDLMDFVWPENVIVPVAQTRAEAEAGTGFTLDFTVRTHIAVDQGDVDCRVEPCSIVASDDFALHRAGAPISFGEVVGPVSASPSFSG